MVYNIIFYIFMTKDPYKTTQGMSPHSGGTSSGGASGGGGSSREDITQNGYNYYRGQGHNSEVSARQASYRSGTLNDTDATKLEKEYQKNKQK